MNTTCRLGMMKFGLQCDRLIRIYLASFVLQNQPVLDIFLPFFITFLIYSENRTQGTVNRSTKLRETKQQKQLTAAEMRVQHTKHNGQNIIIGVEYQQQATNLTISLIVLQCKVTNSQANRTYFRNFTQEREARLNPIQIVKLTRLLSNMFQCRCGVTRPNIISQDNVNKSGRHNRRIFTALQIQYRKWFETW